MNLVQEQAFRSSPIGHPFGRIKRPRCQGRCCGTRTAPVWITFGTRGLLFLCADCRAWQSRVRGLALAELRRAG